MTSEPARARLLWAILFLTLPCHVPVYYFMPKSSPDFVCSDPFCHETFRPSLFRRLAPFLAILGCSRPLVGVDTGSSEVVQETPHPLFFLLSHAARTPHQFSEHHALRQSSVLYVCVCCHPIYSVRQVCGRASRGHTGGRSHRISHRPPFRSACLNFSREKDSAIPFPRRP